MKHCVMCGKEIEDEMDLCPECGKKWSIKSKSWYDYDIFHVAIAPFVRDFDNGTFYRRTVKTIINIIAYGFLFAQPLNALIEWRSGFRPVLVLDQAVILTLGVLSLLLAIFSHSYWMKRIKRIDQIFDTCDDFVVIPLGTYLLQWLGEWIALVLGIEGVFAIILSMFGVHSSNVVMSFLVSCGWIGGICAILVAVVIVFVFRVIAESSRAITAIANNTKKSDRIYNKQEADEKETSGLAYNILYAITIACTVGFLLAAMFK